MIYSELRNTHVGSSEPAVITGKIRRRARMTGHFRSSANQPTYSASGPIWRVKG